MPKDEDGAVAGEGPDAEDAGDEDEGPMSRSRPRRREARYAKVGKMRRRRALRITATVIMVVALIVLASVLAYTYWPRKNNSNPIVVVKTDKGTFEMELFMDKAPKTAGLVKGLVEGGFYNGLTFHRVIKDFVIQGGDNNNDGRAGQGSTIPFETAAGNLKHLRGSVGMASTQAQGPAGTQWYVCVQAQPSLDGNYAVFGKVTTGMSVVDAIDAVPTDSNDKPLSTVTMTQVYIKGQSS